MMSCYGLLFGCTHLGSTLVIDGGGFGDVADFPDQGRGVVQEEVDESGDLGAVLQLFNRHVDEQGPGERRVGAVLDCLGGGD